MILGEKNRKRDKRGRKGGGRGRSEKRDDERGGRGVTTRLKGRQV